MAPRRRLAGRGAVLKSRVQAGRIEPPGLFACAAGILHHRPEMVSAAGILAHEGVRAGRSPHGLAQVSVLHLAQHLDPEVGVRAVGPAQIAAVGEGDFGSTLRSLLPYSKACVCGMELLTDCRSVTLPNAWLLNGE